MKNNTILTAVLVIIMILLAFDVTSIVFSHGAKGQAASKLKYKVVSLEAARTAQKYEELLNKMADQGWTFDHDTMMTGPGAAVFRKETS